jgi:hypothetical protein
MTHPTYDGNNVLRQIPRCLENFQRSYRLIAGRSFEMLKKREQERSKEESKSREGKKKE